MEPRSFREEVRKAVGNRPLSRVATEAGLPRDAIRSVLRGHDPRLSRVVELSDALGLEFYVGPPRHENSSQVYGDLETAMRRTEDFLDRLRAAGADHTGDQPLVAHGLPGEIPGLPGAKPVAVRHLRTAAGSGTCELDEKIRAFVYFRQEWLSRSGLIASRCSIIGVTGESMEPTLPDGCFILTDHNRTQRRHDRIFLVRTALSSSAPGGAATAPGSYGAIILLGRHCRGPMRLRWSVK